MDGEINTKGIQKYSANSKFDLARPRSPQSGLLTHPKSRQGESSKEAFMRRLKKSDPAYDIYATYAEEHTERWAAAKSLSMDEALAQMPEIERKYKLECEEMG